MTLTESQPFMPDQILADRIREITVAKSSLLCVGIDPDPSRLPAHLADRPFADAVRAFGESLIRTTSPLALAFKFNFAFFEALGPAGMDVLGSLVELVPEDSVTIADAKRGDIGNSARFYARSIFESYGFDAATVSPYMGSDSVIPFLEYDKGGIFLLVRTSNAGGSELQTLTSGGRPLYVTVAREAMLWSTGHPGLLGFVTGASDIDALAELRSLCPDTPFLIPGVGAQGGSPEAVVRASGSGPILVNSSRQIIYASAGEDFAERAFDAADDLRSTLWNVYRNVANPYGLT